MENENTDIKIHFDNLIGSLTITSTESTDKIKEAVAKALIEAVNEANKKTKK